MEDKMFVATLAATCTEEDLWKMIEAEEEKEKSAWKEIIEINKRLEQLKEAAWKACHRIDLMQQAKWIVVVRDEES